MDRKGGNIDTHQTVIAQAAGYALLSGNGAWKAALRMSPPERKVLDLIVRGLDSPQIAERLDIPCFMVRSHLENILDKLAMRDCFREWATGGP